MGHKAKQPSARRLDYLMALLQDDAAPLTPEWLARHRVTVEEAGALAVRLLKASVDSMAGICRVIGPVAFFFEEYFRKNPGAGGILLNSGFMRAHDMMQLVTLYRQMPAIFKAAAVPLPGAIDPAPGGVRQNIAGEP